MDQKTPPIDPRDEIVEVDGRKMRRGDTPGFKRVWEEEVVGGGLEFPDGTIVQGSRVVNAGPRAIVGEDGTLIGMRPE